MKNITKLIIGASMLSAVACTDSWLDVEPTKSIPAKIAFSTPETLNASVVGIYRGFMGQKTGGAYNVVFNDIRGEDVVLKSRNNYNKFVSVYNYGYIPSLSLGNNIYFSFYEIIEGCNSIIAADERGEITLLPAVKDPLVAEARAMRAYSYFQLVRMFAEPYSKNGGESPGLALKVTPEVDDLVPRTKVKDAYNLILSDLNYALAHLPAPTRKDRVNRTFVQGLLARVFLELGETQKAIEYAQAALAQMPALSPEIYEIGASQDNPSVIFAIYNTEEVYLGFGAYASYIDYGYKDAGGYGVVGADIDFVNNNYSADDRRNAWFVNRWVYENQLEVDGGKTTWTAYKAKLSDKAFYDEQVSRRNIPAGLWDDATGRIPENSLRDLERIMYDNAFFNIISMYGKFPRFSAQRAVGNQPTPNVGYPNLANVPVMRTPELHLIIAEAAALKGDNALAKQELLAVQQNANAQPYSTGNLLDAIRLERRKELIGEGFRTFDIIRQGKVIERPNYWGPKQYATIDPTDPKSKIIFPIPQKEIDNNPLFTEQDQNAAYK
ncbi:RagB/SusD family nutrient uptake outer membrane protein [Ornithobacterium rhinotracheale]|uniref:RagB/SusD family nutrient uptake outer membrane protein n=1 Tax=Ornithobacterium rhinotracheale TaxID=28251 RepID=A0A3R5YWP1_ORNRH|nr:RagB/SusD family nutrient uptake outer membrane protein [Ornithobacterium rhinotracheale]QAR31268.1 RagB/SusD family nutrient uptake outer membrane protein [Ornithobacterium rhinotracheale]